MAFHATMNRTTTIIINAHAHIRSLSNTYTWTTTMTTTEALIATALLLLLHNKTNESLPFGSLFVSYTLHTLFSVHARDKFLVKVICCCFIYLFIYIFLHLLVDYISTQINVAIVHRIIMTTENNWNHISAQKKKESEEQGEETEKWREKMSEFIDLEMGWNEIPSL